VHRLWLSVLVVGLQTACTTPSRPIVTERSMVDAGATSYRVRAGDTLYSIAWRHGLDYRVLARRNAIEPPYLIRPGQVIRLRGSDGSGAAATPRPAPTRDAKSARKWRWPASGRVLREFGHGNKGIDFEVAAGTPVVAVASGEVVYAASGLRGHETLIIVKHDAAWLTAYSLNQPSRVAEGDTIAAGHPLADVTGMGPAAALHFEIRRDGDPVNPRSVIAAPLASAGGRSPVP